MADIKSGTSTRAICNESCGCPIPCPADNSCRCMKSASGEEVHMKCSCGEHCGCNPCTCRKEEIGGACKCGPACTCSTCAA